MTRSVLTVLLLAGCAAPKSHTGLDLATASYDIAEQRLQRLARAAQAGDRSARPDLGRRFQGADGVPEDLDRACRLHLSAATTTGGTIHIHSPPVTLGGAGRVFPPHASASKHSVTASAPPNAPPRPASPWRS